MVKKKRKRITGSGPASPARARRSSPRLAQSAGRLGRERPVASFLGLHRAGFPMHRSRSSLSVFLLLPLLTLVFSLHHHHHIFIHALDLTILVSITSLRLYPATTTRLSPSLLPGAKIIKIKKLHNHNILRHNAPSALRAQFSPPRSRHQSARPRTPG